MADRTVPVPPFEPRIISDAMHGDRYEDGRVHGDVDVAEDGERRAITISGWSSCWPGQGHTAEALRWLRARFDTIAANGVGLADEVDGRLVPDDTMAYWAHLRDKGLVDVFIDDDGHEIDRDFEPVAGKTVRCAP